MRVFAIHAHPDDLEILAGGTISHLTAAGHVVEVATMTAGDKGSAEHSAAESAEIRREEGRRGAEAMGAGYACLEFLDLEITHDNDSRRRVCEAVRRAKPDIVITSAPVDYMSDHEVTSRLVFDACFSASVPNYRTHAWEPAEPTAAVPALYYCDPVGLVDHFGKPILPQFCVDISTTFEQKLAALACHESQREWLRRQHGMDEYLDDARRQSRERGELVGVEFGEGFRQHLGHPLPHENRLADLLPSSTVHRVESSR